MSTTSETAVGGMKSKIEAAKIAVRSGIPLVIASGRNKNALAEILAGQDEGTLFIAKPNRLQGRKRWIAFSSGFPLIFTRYVFGTCEPAFISFCASAPSFVIKSKPSLA